MPVTRRGLPLLLTIAVHLLLACLFLARRGAVPSAPSGPQRFFVALIARPAQRPRRPPIAPPTAVRSRAPPAAAPARTARPHDAAAAPLAPASEAAPVPPPAISAGAIIERARRDVGQIDRALRGGTPPVPAVRPDTAQARFERTMAGAWKDRSQTMVVERYTSADGVVIERVSRGADGKCYMSGTVNFVPGILHDSSRPQTVSCPPAGNGWARK